MVISEDSCLGFTLCIPKNWNVVFSNDRENDEFHHIYCPKSFTSFPGLVDNYGGFEYCRSIEGSRAFDVYIKEVNKIMKDLPEGAISCFSVV